jgi:DNA modification methylase
LGVAVITAVISGAQGDRPLAVQGSATCVNAAPTLADVPNLLYYGDNLDVLRQHIGTESVDLIYLDPPFNSNRSYNVLFKAPSGEASQAQIEAFDDTWHWSQQTEALYAKLVGGGASVKVAEAIEAMHDLLGPNDVLAYLVMMTARLVELHRVLKPTGSLYLHCDPTASHYLKIVLDAIFGPEQFLSEVIWKRTGTHSSANRWGPIHDVILVYGGRDGQTWNRPYRPLSDTYKGTHYRQKDKEGRAFAYGELTAPGTRNGRSGAVWRNFDVTALGRHWTTTVEKLDAMDADGRIYWPSGGGWPRLIRYEDESKGQAIGDVWEDISPINMRAKERLGYPTQKPLALLERIIEASSNEGDVVLDPFCGCGTTIDAAQKLGRRWVGIDVTYLAIDLIRKRLRHTYGPEIESTYEVHGIPTDVPGAEALFNENPFDFERWAVSMVSGQPNEKQVGDKGIDGRIRFYADKDAFGTVVVSVKGGKQVAPTMMRDLVGTVQNHKAEMGLLILLSKPTRGMTEVADHSGTYTVPLTGSDYPKIQIVTVADLLAGKRPKMPPPILPYVQASPKPQSEAVPLF